MDNLDNKEYEKALRKSFRKGMRRGVIATVVVCVVLFFCITTIRDNQLNKTTVAVKVTDESGAQNRKILEYDTLLDEETILKINSLAAAIQSSYYEDVEEEALREGLYQGLFNSLDIYSTYYTADEYEELYNMEIAGSYCGIGATLSQDIDTMVVTVVAVQEGSPAERTGLKVNDIIVQADEYEAAAMELDEFVTHLRGEAGTSVTVEVYRPSEEEYYTFEMVREALEIESVECEMLKDNVGYIQITQFMGTTAEHFDNALAELQDQGMTSLIVDLRNNPGGMLDSVTAILDDILSEGLIVYTEDKYGNREEVYAADEKSLDLPLVVLVNENSASASEIFAGAIKDYQVGTLVGTTTYGKGIVQGMQQLADGSALKMTTSRYYTPSGVCIHEIGVEPDVVLEYQWQGAEDEEYDYYKDNQILKALEILTKNK